MIGPRSIWLRTLIGFGFDKTSFCIYTWDNQKRCNLLVFPVTTKHFGEDEKDCCDAAVEIALPEGEDGETTLYSILSRTAWEQHTQEPDAIKRWLAAPDEFSCPRPVCPVCGSPARLAGFGDNGWRDRHMLCDCCSWISRSSFDCNEMEKPEFKKELRYIKRLQLTKHELDAATGSVDTGLETLEKLYLEKKNVFSKEQYISALEGIKKQIERTIKNCQHQENTVLSI